MAYTTIKKPSDYFNTVLHTGNNSSGRTFTGYGHQPDFIWTKVRDSANYNHTFVDSVRGGDKMLATNSTAIEDAGSHGIITSWNSDGVTWIDGTNGTYPRLYYNDNGSLGGDDYVNWSWKAGGTAVSNTDGSITSSVSSNPTSGFSVVTYTSNGTSGATVGHGLGVAPSMIIVKRRNSAEDWGVGHQSLTWNNFLRLNTTGASSASAGLWNNTAPDSDKFTLGNSGISNNGSGTTMVAYCFADVKGFSKFGSYVGNGSTDGTFVYTGFKPAMVIMKRTDVAQSWIMFDNKRDTYNEATKVLYPNLTNADDANNLDLLSNGFKPRSASSFTNGTSNNYIYMAFAEQPLVGDNPATAR